MGDREGFLGRWSRRKRRARDGDVHDPAVEVDDPERAAEEGPHGAAADARPEGPEEPEEDVEALIERLPDIETVTEKTDMRPFLDPRIPEALRRRALRRLWRSNPVFANLDGLNDYDEDYTDAAMVVPGLKTAYQVGRGIVRRALDDPPDAGADEMADARSPDADREQTADGEGAEEADGTGPADDAGPDDGNKVT